jgi:hypothetical protein
MKKTYGWFVALSIHYSCLTLIGITHARSYTTSLQPTTHMADQPQKPTEGK